MLPLHQCHCVVEAFGFLPPTDEPLTVGLLVVLDGRRGGGGGVGGFGALDLVFPVCKGVVFFDADARDCPVAGMPSFFFSLAKVASPTLELSIFLAGRFTELDFCLPATCKSILAGLVK